MLLNRISLRVATAVGSAAVVAGATFAVTAFADTGEPDRTTSTVSSDQGPKDGENFFADSSKMSEKEREKQRKKAKKEMNKADNAAETGGKASTKEKEKQEEESSDSEESSSVPSGSPKSMAKSMLADRGWSDQFSCLDKLWEKESGWDPNAENPSSGAYGIPQALPGSKMSSAGSDWKTNPKTQIEWGLGYIDDRYGSPCEAWSFSQSNGHY